LSAQAAGREGTTADVIEQRTIAKIPLGRMGDPREFGDVVAFLASPGASYVSGVTIQVDGGWTRGLV
jgi:3-oxoacyl-[acyl-carrier protein] reductase